MEELQMVKEKLAQDYERLKNDETVKEKRLKDLSAISDKKEQAKQDMKGLLLYIFNSKFFVLYDKILFSA